jgi:hypothetical protein
MRGLTARTCFGGSRAQRARGAAYSSLERSFAVHVRQFCVMVGCACRKLDSAVLMMKSAEDRLSSELAEPLDRPMARRILTQGQMRSEFVVEGRNHGCALRARPPIEMGLIV